MKKLTNQEIKFIKETGWTPTLVQMSYSTQELNKTPYKGFDPEDAANKYFELAEKFGVDLNNLYNKACNSANSDNISLEFDATYLFYTFFTPDELLDLDTQWALQWLQDFKYFFGYRKWDEQYVEIEIQEALEIYGGSREFYEQDGEMWNRKIED